MEALGFLVVFGVILLQIISKQEKQRKQNGDAERTMPPKIPFVAQDPPSKRAAAPKISADTPDGPPKYPTAPIGQVSAKRREQLRSAAQWREAKRQQDDAEEVHSIRMDTCEKRLESLRVLHEAGILDDQEYAQRVARVKSSHKR